jgi:alpha-tubulin suppressor-like RCC1 family protein
MRSGRPYPAALVAAAVAIMLALPTPTAATGDGVVAVSAGGEHACALLGDKTVACWGDDHAGQLGDGTTGDGDNLRLHPVKVQQNGHDMTGLTAVSAGGAHTCALKGNGTVWCWGLDFDGQLGDGSTGGVSRLSTSPLQVQTGSGALTGVAHISAGLDATCAVKKDGTAWCWGYDQYGQIGDGTTGDVNHDRLIPTRVRRTNGPLTRVADISAGEVSTCARTSDGAAWCWGDASSGEVGNGTYGDPVTNRQLVAVRVVRAGGPLTNVSAVSVGASFACARRTDGSAWCWGYAKYGEVGDGTTGRPAPFNDRRKAVQVVQGKGFLTGVKDVQAGSFDGCARRSDATLRCWGNDADGEVGDGTTGNGQGVRLRAVEVVHGQGHFSHVTSVATGDQFTCAARSDLTAWCWGRNANGQLGIGVFDTNPHPEPERVQFP